MSNRTMSKAGLCRLDVCERYSFVLIYTFFLHVAMQAFFIFMIVKYGDRTSKSEIQFVKDNWFFFTLGCFYTAYTLLQQCVTKRCTVFISSINFVLSPAAQSYQATQNRPLSSRTGQKQTSSKRTKVKSSGTYQVYKGGLWIGLRIGLCLVLNFLIQQIFGTLAQQTYVIDTSDLYLHAIFGGMTEELFFRAFVQQSVYDVLHEYVFKRKNKIGAGIISIIVGSVSFGLAHINRYGLDPIALGAPMVAGFNYGIFYFLSVDGNVLETMLVHAVNNWIAIDQQVKGSLIGPSNNASMIIALLMILCIFAFIFMYTKMEDLKRTKIHKLFKIVCISAILCCINGAILNILLLYICSTCLIIFNVIIYAYLKRDSINKTDTILILFICIAMTIAIIILMLDMGMKIILY
jgi:membrane protease YdiL (CAAX protease family)